VQPSACCSDDWKCTKWPLAATLYWLRSWASADRGKWGQLTPWKMDEKLKVKTCKNSSFLNVLRAIRAGRCRERRYADHIFNYSDILQNAPFRSQIFKIFFASGGKGALTPNQNPAVLDNRYCRTRVLLHLYRERKCADTIGRVLVPYGLANSNAKIRVGPIFFK